MFDVTVGDLIQNMWTTDPTHSGAIAQMRARARDEDMDILIVCVSGPDLIALVQSQLDQISARFEGSTDRGTWVNPDFEDSDD